MKIFLRRCCYCQKIYGCVIVFIEEETKTECQNCDEGDECSIKNYGKDFTDGICNRCYPIALKNAYELSRCD